MDFFFILYLINRFFNEVEKVGQKEDKNKKTVIAYGASIFHHTGRNERSVPTSSIYRKFCQRFKVHDVPEFNTTKLCHECMKPTSRVFEKKPDGKKVLVRGLRWCGYQCSRFLSRDGNSAMAMWKICPETNGGNPRPREYSTRYPNAPDVIVTSAYLATLPKLSSSNELNIS
jgi:hypothetical protein